MRLIGLAITLTPTCVLGRAPWAYAQIKVARSVSVLSRYRSAFRRTRGLPRGLRDLAVRGGGSREGWRRRLSGRRGTDGQPRFFGARLDSREAAAGADTRSRAMKSTSRVRVGSGRLDDTGSPASPPTDPCQALHETMSSSKPAFSVEPWMRRTSSSMRAVRSFRSSPRLTCVRYGELATYRDESPSTRSSEGDRDEARSPHRDRLVGETAEWEVTAAVHDLERDARRL